MKKLSLLASAALMATCFATAAMAVPTTISFGLSGGNNGIDVGQSKTYGGVITLTAWNVTKTDWSNGGGISYLSSGTQLFERQLSPNDIGVGVCNAEDRTPIAFGINHCLGVGDTSEIDNNGSTIDIVRITLADGWKFLDMTLSSLDNASTPGSVNNDTFRLFGSNAANPDLTGLSAADTGNEASTGSVNPTISLLSVQGFKYLYLTGSANLNMDDFLLRSITVDTTGPGGQEVPEPASLALLGAGLLGLGLARRRHSKV